MADYFFDSSAVVKRYINELGSVFIDGLVNVEHENNIFLAQITRVEVASAIARRRKGKTLAVEDAVSALQSFTNELADIYLTIDITADLVINATDLASKHALRGFDAVQLAAALDVNAELLASDMPPLIFVSADGELNAAAIAEGLNFENPNYYP